MRDDAAKRAMDIAIDRLGTRPGGVVRRDEIAARLGATSDRALATAEARGWVRAVGGDYLEVTRRGYVGDRRG